jgi:Tfp pilus assembly protein PilN
MASKIEAKEAAVILSGRDLIIRTFDMPILPREELASAVNFEVKKYIPFKLEDLISDFQRNPDKTNRKNYILFVGIKKEALDKYFLVLEQLELKIEAIEYSAFSIVRLLNLANVREKGIIAVAGIDLVKNDEANFVVLEGDFPLFSRDITLISASQEEIAGIGEDQSGRALERLKRELHISLDYYNRKFPNKKINKMFFIIDENYQADLEMLAKEIGLNIQFIDTTKYFIDKTIPFSLAFIKAYSGSLLEVNTGIRINLLSVKERALKKVGVLQPAEAILITGIKTHFMVAAISLFICALVFFFGLYRILPLKKELENTINLRPRVSIVNQDSSYEKLSNLYSEYKYKATTLENLIKNRLYLTSLLDLLPRLVPQGMWLTDFSFENKREENKIKLILEGMAYLGDNSKELELVNNFFANLKKDPLFIKYFAETGITSIDTRQVGKDILTHFVISSQNYKGK